LRARRSSMPRDEAYLLDILIPLIEPLVPPEHEA